MNGARVCSLLLGCLWVSPISFAKQAPGETPGQTPSDFFIDAGTHETDPRYDFQEWRFRVFLDESEIGHHSFRVKHLDSQSDLTEPQVRVEMDASFQVKILFVTAYAYDHVNEELWGGDCLTRIDSRTRVNGQRFAVDAVRTDEVLRVRSQVQERQQVEALPSCVMSFAYWNPRFLNASRLLNSQTGEYIDVEIESLASEQIQVRGQPVLTDRYRLLADELKIDLWYTLEGQWVALESEVKGGRLLRYQLI